MKIRFTCFSIIAALFAAAVVSANPRCGSESHMQHLSVTQSRQFMQYVQRHAALLSQFQAQPASHGRTIYTIPVVVHVVYQNATENISDAQVQSQIDVLNEDFARLNPDTANTPAAFNVAGPTSFRFCLAQRDPDDNPTTGIIHVPTGVSVFSDTLNDVKFTAAGGSDAWDVDHYLNIWVCDLDSSITGYPEYPDFAPHTHTYGAVINYRYFGRGGTSVAPFNLGRTATHMVAHCLGLHHIWGDDGGNCSGDDGIADTPIQADATTGCLVFPATDSCTTGGNGIMFMNYMDNSDDNCRNMFTLGQDGWMVFEMGFSFPTLLNSSTCQAVVLTDNDIWLRQIISPQGSSCNLTVTPVVQLKNYGNIPITAANIHYAYDGGGASTYAWSGNLASLATISVALPSTTLSPGSHTLQVYTDQPNGVADPVTSNDTMAVIFDLVGHGSAYPIVENFESGVFPSPGWTLNNPDMDYTWANTTLASHGGTYSMTVDNYDYSNTGSYDEYDTPISDPSSVVNPVLTFDVGYTYFYLAGPSPTISTDTLEVLVSTDCGATFNRVYYKGGAQLATAPPTDVFFVPTSSQWRTELISLAAYAGDSQLVVKFRNITGFGNNVYIDNINLTSLTGLSQPAAGTVSVYPNPATNRVTIRLATKPVSPVHVMLYDATGREVASWRLTDQETSLSTSHLAPGLYSMHLHGAPSGQVLLLSITR